jgi:hypothetical protein
MHGRTISESAMSHSTVMSGAVGLILSLMWMVAAPFLVGVVPGSPYSRLRLRWPTAKILCVLLVLSMEASGASLLCLSISILVGTSSILSQILRDATEIGVVVTAVLGVGIIGLALVSRLLYGKLPP